MSEMKTANQRQWLKEADSWSAYKWCCDEVAAKYQKRIKAIRKR